MSEIQAKAMAGDVPVYCSHDEIVEAVKLVPNPKNPNQHPPEQIRLLGQIIQTAGWRQPITVSKRSGFIVKGHGRLMAAQAAGLELIPVDYQEYASEAAEYADLIADNRLAELSEIDSGMLRDLLAEIDLEEVPIELTGYDEDFLAELMSEDEPEEEEEIEGEIKFSEVLREEHNYVVLYFDNEVDWLQAESLLNLERVQSLSTRKDGKIKNPHIGVGRVLNGARALEVIRLAYQCELSILQEAES